MDLGTANSIIVSSAGKILLDRAIVALIEDRADSIGRKGTANPWKTHENIRTVRPLRDGVIADFNLRNR